MATPTATTLDRGRTRTFSTGCVVDYELAADHTREAHRREGGVSAEGGR